MINLHRNITFLLTSIFACLATPLTLQAGENDEGLNSNIEEEIVVVGMFIDEDRVTGSAHRVEAELLEAFRYDDLNRILNFVPGVYIREEDGFGLRPNIGLRGGSSDRSQKVALMEDGVLFSPAPYSAPAAYFFPLIQRSVGVEVYKGPASIEFGPQTIGGAINLTTALIPEEREFEAGLSAGSDAYRSLHVRAGGEFSQGGLLGEFVHIGSDGFKQLDGGGDTGFEKNEVSLKAAREIGPGTLELRIGYADEVSDETYLGLTEADFRADPERRYAASGLDLMEWDWQGVRGDWQQRLFGGELIVTSYYHAYERAWRKFNSFSGANIRDVLDNPDAPTNQILVNILRGADTDGLAGSIDDIRIGTNDREFVSTGTQASMTWSFGDRIEHRLRVGGRYHYDRIRRLHDEFGFEQANGSLVQGNLGRAIVTDNTGRTDTFVLWARDEIFINNWTIVPGVRIEQIENEFRNRLAAREQSNDYLVVLPGLGVNIEIMPGLNVIAGVHEGFSPATPSLTADLEEERATNYELGGVWKGRFGRFELTGYVSDYENLTAICTFSSGCSSASVDTQTNAGEVRTEGLEFGWQHTLTHGALRIPLGLTYTYTNSEFEEGFSSSNPQFGVVEAGFQLPYIPEHRANLTAGIVQEKWGIQLSLTYVDEMRDQAGSGSLAPGQGSDALTILDLAGHYKPRPDWTLSARVDNATDEVEVVSRRPFGARPSKPLAVRFEARYQLKGAR
jgi:Fe(3+) dicitrate transport protein